MRWRIWSGVSLCCGLLALGLLDTLVPDDGVGYDHRPLMGAMVAAAFLAFQVWPLEIDVRGRPFVFTLGSMALATGLFVLPPTNLLIARLAGGLVGLALVRRAPPSSIMFQACSMVAQVGVATTLFVGFAGSDALVSRAAGADLTTERFITVVALVAVLAAALVESVAAAIWAVITHGPLRDRGVDVVRYGALVALPAGAVGALAGMSIYHDPWAGLVVFIAGVGVVTAIAAHARLADDHALLESLHRFTGEVDLAFAHTREELDDAVVDSASDALAARVVLVRDDADTDAIRVVGSDGVQFVAAAELAPTAEPPDTGQPSAASSGDGRSELPPDLAQHLGLDDGEVVAVPLPGERTNGWIVAARRPDASRSLGRDAARALEAFAGHYAALAEGTMLDRELRAYAVTDPVTGLGNLPRLEADLHERMLVNRETALGIVDVDGYDDVLVTFGPATAADLVVAVAGALVERCGPCTVYRLEGMTFALVRDAAPEAELVEFVRQFVASTDVTVSAGPVEFPVRVTVGVSMTVGDVGDPGWVEPLELTRRSAAAMLAARRAGRRWLAHTDSVDHHHARRIRMLADLRPAILGGGLSLVYQPKVAVADARPIGVEALARWSHPTWGPVSPDEFVPLAEAAGIVADLTDAVLEIALGDLRGWLDGGLVLHVAVNLSARDLDRRDFAERVIRRVERAGVPPARVQFEITETARPRDPDMVRENLGRLTSHGFVVAMDDFGTGFSSLLSLRQAHVGALKIDRRFVEHLPHDLGDLTIVRSSIDLAHSLGLSVVAEGVESAEAFEVLRALGCDAAQGFHLSVPLPAGDVPGYFAAAGPTGP